MIRTPAARRAALAASALTAITASALLAGCGGGSDSSSKSTAARQLSLAELAGTYQTKCLKSPAGYESSTIVVTADSFTETIRRYDADATCSDAKKVLTRVLTYAAKEDFAAATVEEGLEIRPTPVKFTLKDITVSIHVEATAEASGVAKLYEYAEWTKDEAKSVAGRARAEGVAKEPSKAETSYIFLGNLGGKLTQSPQAAKATEIEYKRYTDAHAKK